MAAGRVGTLDNLGLAVYVRADGSLYYSKDGARVDVHGNQHWTTTSGECMRGRSVRPPAASAYASAMGQVPMPPVGAPESQHSLMARLKGCFPHCEDVVLAEVLIASGGDMDRAASQLLEIGA